MAKHAKAARDAHARPDLDRAGPAGRARRHHHLGACQARRTRSTTSTNPSGSPLKPERWPSPNRSRSRWPPPIPGSIPSWELIGDSPRTVQAAPCSASREAATSGRFDGGGTRPAKPGTRWGLPAVNDEHAYALEISGNSMKPAYRNGDVIVVSPGTPIRRGDRVVVKTTGGEVMVKELKRRTARTLELQSLNPAMPSAAHIRRCRMDRKDCLGEPVGLRSSLPGLTRQSINQKTLCEARWMRGSSPRMTSR